MEPSATFTAAPVHDVVSELRKAAAGDVLTRNTEVTEGVSAHALALAMPAVLGLILLALLWWGLRTWRRLQRMARLRAQLRNVASAASQPSQMLPSGALSGLVSTACTATQAAWQALEQLRPGSTAAAAVRQDIAAAADAVAAAVVASVAVSDGAAASASAGDEDLIRALLAAAQDRILPGAALAASARAQSTSAASAAEREEREARLLMEAAGRLHSTKALAAVRAALCPPSAALPLEQRLSVSAASSLLHSLQRASDGSALDCAGPVVDAPRPEQRFLHCCHRLDAAADRRRAALLRLSSRLAEEPGLDTAALAIADLLLRELACFLRADCAAADVALLSIATAAAAAAGADRSTDSERERMAQTQFAVLKSSEGIVLVTAICRLAALLGSVEREAVLAGALARGLDARAAVAALADADATSTERIASAARAVRRIEAAAAAAAPALREFVAPSAGEGELARAATAAAAPAMDDASDSSDGERDCTSTAASPSEAAAAAVGSASAIVAAARPPHASAAELVLHSVVADGSQALVPAPTMVPDRRWASLPPALASHLRAAAGHAASLLGAANAIEGLLSSDDDDTDAARCKPPVCKPLRDAARSLVQQLRIDRASLTMHVDVAAAHAVAAAAPAAAAPGAAVAVGGAAAAAELRLLDDDVGDDDAVSAGSGDARNDSDASTSIIQSPVRRRGVTATVTGSGAAMVVGHGAAAGGRHGGAASGGGLIIAPSADAFAVLRSLLREATDERNSASASHHIQDRWHAELLAQRGHAAAEERHRQSIELHRDVAQQGAEHQRRIAASTIRASASVANRAQAAQLARQDAESDAAAAEAASRRLRSHESTMLTIALVALLLVTLGYCWRAVTARVWAVLPLSCEPEECWAIGSGKSVAAAASLRSAGAATTATASDPASSSSGGHGFLGRIALLLPAPLAWLLASTAQAAVRPLAAAAATIRRVMPCLCMPALRSGLMIAGGIAATGGARLLLHAHAGNAVLAAAGSALVWPALQQQANLALRAPRLVPALLIAIALLVLPRRLLRSLPPRVRDRLRLLPPPLRSLDALTEAHLQRLNAASERDLVASGMQDGSGSASPRPDAADAIAAATDAAGRVTVTAVVGAGGRAVPGAVTVTPAAAAARDAGIGIGSATHTIGVGSGSGSSGWLASLLPLLLLHVAWPLAAAAGGYLCGVLLGSPSPHYYDDVAAHAALLWRLLARLLRFLAAM